MALSDRDKLVQILQAAYSGEKAAALAYQGHWRSVKNPSEREKIQSIELEEWEHRKIVGEMLVKLEAKPSEAREFIFGTIGSTLKMLCPISGWFLPMYFAGLLESQNIKEYSQAAHFAQKVGETLMAEQLLKMAEVEREHETYFFEVVKKFNLK
ncbi:MAG: ferritin-like domain-containing protein [Candidatus Caenarcaniphilales bacterium]|nr:ferritin-like domain-containing protein [Candidatus Caenarcaniphilales bacterium]